MDLAPFTLDLAGVRLSGATRGPSPQAVLLHGFGGSGADWDRVWAELPANLPVLRYDQRGFGGSAARTSEPYSHTADLLALLDARGIPRADLVGLSQGGAVALHFALEHPERVRRLVLVSPALTGWQWSDEWKAHWRAASAAARGGDMAEARRRWATHPMFAEAMAGPEAGELIAAITAFSGQQWLSDPALPEVSDVDRLGQLTAPTLLLSGERDFADFHGIAALLQAGIPDLRTVSFPTAGHMLNLEAPAAVAREIATHLQ